MTHDKERRRLSTGSTHEVSTRHIWRVLPQVVVGRCCFVFLRKMALAVLCARLVAPVLMVNLEDAERLAVRAIRGGFAASASFVTHGVVEFHGGMTVPAEAICAVDTSAKQKKQRGGGIWDKGRSCFLLGRVGVSSSRKLFFVYLTVFTTP